ncbi:MAG: GNAT family N-acetyltransferase [Ardenticatenaceae bacterium]|nr:GNAT family N-acetyltransferase [Ardenticatenaceae bacterium]
MKKDKDQPQYTYALSEVVSRSYRGGKDLKRLQQFVIEAARVAKKPLVYLHLGDLAWRMFRSLTFDPQRHIHLWETKSGEVLGFAWFHSSHNGVDVQVHPGWRGRGVGGQMVRWAEMKARRELPDRGRGQALRFSCFDFDQQRQKTLINQRYRPDPFHYVHFQQKLIPDMAQPSLPTGFSIRTMTDHDVGERAVLHDAAFFATEVTSGSFARVMKAPGYRPEFDLIAAGPGGRLAGFALCWIDDVNKVALFEPVGVHPDFRQLGLGKALVLEGLRRMQEAGLQTAWVYTEKPNLPAQRLYARCGFKVVGRAYDYVKQL